MNRTRIVSFVSGVLLVAAGAFARDLPNIDKFGEQSGRPEKAATLAAKAQNFGGKKVRLSGEARLGVPTFLWSTPGIAHIPASFRPVNNENGNAEGAARAYLGGVASLYDLDDADVSQAPVRMIHDTGKGPVVVKLQQKVNGIEIFREELNVVMTQNLDLVAVSGYITSHNTPANARAGSLAFRVNEQNAAAAAVRDLTSVSLNAGQLTQAGSRDGYDFFTVASGSGAMLTDPVRMKKVYFHTPDGLEPAYYVEVFAADTTGDPNLIPVGHSSDSDAYSYVISAVDGSVLFRMNLTRDAKAPSQQSNALPAGGFTYRVWADPVTGIPYDSPAGNDVHPKISGVADGAQYPFAALSDVTLPNFPFSQNDPWLAPGSTTTVGNNVDAYVNLINGSAPNYTASTTDNGYGPVAAAPYSGTKTFANGGGDFRAFTTSTDAFLHAHSAGVDPSTAEARQGAIQQLFYNINFLHDWYYDAGFNEASGNAQTNNFGRGGLGNDSIKAQAQDVSARNNANMQTPADGVRPRMRMYVFDTAAPRFIKMTAPSTLKFTNTGTNVSGPQSFDFTGNYVYEGGGCTAYNDAAGKIVMVNYNAGSDCTIGTKTANAKASGAIGFTLVWNSTVPDQTVNITGTGDPTFLPTLNLSWNAAAVIKNALLNGPVTVQFRRDAGTDRDGTVDNQIVFHEWGHYLSNRLVGNASGLNTNHAGGMGEGWGDFNALMLTVRADDTNTATNATWNGTYAMATYVSSGGATDPVDGNNGYYYGGRRVPYSTDMSKDGLTFRHIADGQALPAGVAAVGPNSEVHNTGEVWATMLWECYASILRDTQGPNPRLTFQQAQDRMKQYLVVSLKMTPTSPTFTEARDAVLAAAYATDLIDYQRFSAAFAKRGAGLGAVSPDRYSTDNVGVVESFISGADVNFVSASLVDDTGSCDNDGSLDNNETGTLSITLRNTGDSTLTSTTATVTSTNPNVTFTNGGVLTFGSFDPATNATATIGVALNGAVGVQTIDVTINYNDPTLAVAGPRTTTVYMRGNTSVIPSASATDDVEAPVTRWTTSFNAALNNAAPFVIQQSTGSTNHFWYGPDAAFTSDQYLVSPVLTVNGGGSANLQFDHSWGFEFDAGGNYDGGVVEMSVNGGAFADIGSPAYNGTILSGGSNPLRGRVGFVKNSVGTVHTSLTQAIAPGSTVQFRFRVGSDSAAGAAGWTIDNIAINGVVETPFDVVVADPGCAKATSTTLVSNANPSGLGSSVTFTASVASLGGTPTGGTITFKDGGATLANVAISGGTAAYSTSGLSAGTHNITASYSGAAGFYPSNSNTVVQSVGKASSSVVVGSSANPAMSGNAVTITATVSSVAGTPTGSVTFTEGATTLATSALSGGVATYTTSSLSGGAHTITATYNGSASINASSSSLVQNIDTGAVINFVETTLWPMENSGSVTLNLTRSGGNTSGAASVNVATVNGTAIAGVRFNALSQTVNFAAGETSKNVMITLIDTLTVEGKQTFTVTLSAPNAAGLGTSTVATISIMDDDAKGSDFSGTSDGMRDIVWRNPVTGDTRVWLMNGTTINSAISLPGYGTQWKLVGVADFNGDGHGDIVWRNSADFTMKVSYMRNTDTVIGTGTIETLADATWVPVAIGDINNDGFPDIIWRNTSSFLCNAWIMRDTDHLSTAALPTVPDAGWQVIGLGDFNRDHKTDMVWRHAPTTKMAIWAMDGTTFTGATFLPNVGAPWLPVGVGDMNGDGDADLIWQTTTTRQIALWQMNQTSFGSAYFINTASDSATANDSNWSIVAPR